MKKRTDTHDDIKKQAPTFEDFEAAWRRHAERMDLRIRECAPGRAEEAACLARWYAARQAARRKRRERVAGTVLAVFLTAFAATAAWHTVPAPGLVAFNIGAASEVREASLLSVYMLDHE